MSESKRELQRTMSLTDLDTSSLIRDVVEHDLTIPADRNKHRFFVNLPKHDLILPSLLRFDADFRKFLLSVIVNYSLLRDLEEAKCLNWCDALRKFLPLSTLADGNCLMNAASLSMWSINDRRLTLRKSVYQVLIEDQSDIFKNRWQLDQETRLEEQHGSVVDCSSEEWLRDWKKTLELASTKQSADTNCYSALEEIHIFALSNVLRRPIIVLCDDVFRGNYDESLADVKMGGIYLPLQSEAVDCIKSPLLIGYHQGHFTALVTTEDGSINVSDEEEFSRDKSKNAVPLVKSDGSPMKIHFLLPEERQDSDRLLREYLDCSNIEHVKNGGQQTILVAVLKSQEPEVHLDKMFKTYFDALQAVYLEKLSEKMSSRSNQGRNGQLAAFRGGNTSNYHPEFSYETTRTSPPRTEIRTSSQAGPCCSEHKKCKTTGCKYYTKKAHGFCHRCKEDERQLCTSPGCTFMANPDYQGLCSMCFTRYHAILKQEQTAVRPTAPPPNPCRIETCRNPGNPELHHLCINCYLTNIHVLGVEKLAAGTPGWTSGEFQLLSQSTSKDTSRKQEQSEEVPADEEMPSPTMVPKITRQVSLFCQNQNCQNNLEDSASAYCSECMENMDVEIPTNSAVKTCKHPACGGIIQPGNLSDTCNRCLDSFQPANASQKSSVISGSMSTIQICHVAGCTMPSVTYHGELCLAHYRQSQHRQKNSPAHQHHCVNAMHESQGTLCINNGCKFYGYPETNYLCSNCHAKALQELYEMEKSKEEDERVKAEWLSRNYAKTSSHPNRQPHQLEMPYAPRKTFYMENTCNSGRTSMSAPPSPNLRRKWTTKTTPCATQGCPHFGTDEKKGLCDICYDKLSVLYHCPKFVRGRFCSDP